MCFFGACTGFVSGQGGQGEGERGPSVSDTQEETNAAWVRLTNAQYQNTLQDLLGQAVDSADSLPEDEYVHGFRVAGKVSSLAAEKISIVAEQVAAEGVQDIAAFIGCDPVTTGQQMCVEHFMDSFAFRAFRRPVTESERIALMELYETTLQEYDFATGIQVLVEAILQSPAFIYRQQIGEIRDGNGTLAHLNDWEMASRLSYAIWNTMPDQELFDAASSGTLNTSEQIAAQAVRMLEDPKAEQGVQNLFRQWLNWDKLKSMQKDTTLYSEFDQEFAQILHQSLELYAAEIFGLSDDGLGQLFSAPMIFANDRMAQVYEFEGSSGQQLVKVELDGEKRIGLLGQPGLLALLGKTDQSDPIHRGVFVRQQLLCQQLPAPPNNVVINIAAPAEGLTTRERFAQHSADPSCRGCHELIDPIGFGFEEFGALGEYREQDGGVTVDASGQVTQTEDMDGDFVGLSALSTKLSQSSEAAACLSRRWFRIAMNRVENDSDEILLNELVDELHGQKGSLKAVLLQIVSSEAFATRRIESNAGGQP